MSDYWISRKDYDIWTTKVADLFIKQEINYEAEQSLRILSVDRASSGALPAGT
jgi:hypothetical protein